MLEIMHYVGFSLPRLVTGTLLPHQFYAGDLSTIVAIIEFLNCQELSDVGVHARYVIAGDVIEIAVNPGQVSSCRTFKDAERRFRGAVVVEVECDEPHWHGAGPYPFYH